MEYYCTLEKGGKITLPQDVIDKLELNEGESVFIFLAKPRPHKDGYYAYLTKTSREERDLIY